MIDDASPAFNRDRGPGPMSDPFGWPSETDSNSGTAVAERLLEEPSPDEEAEWDLDRERHLFRAAAERVRARTNPLHWDAFVRTALNDQPGQEVADALNLSPTNVYAIKSRLMKEIKDEVRRFGED